MARVPFNSVLLVALCLGLGSVSARASETPARMTRSEADSGIRGLEWPTDEVQILTEIVNGKKQHFGILEGKYPNMKRALTLGPTQIARSKSGLFRVKFPLNGTTKILQFASIAEDGRVERETLFINVPNLDAKFAPLATDKRWSVFPSIGATFMSYSEQYVQDFRETALTAKISARYLLIPPSVDVGFTGFLNVLPISSKGPQATARFLGLNGRIGYALPWLHEPWRLGMMVGVYYLSMFVSTNPETGLPFFGFSNLMGPQFFPTVRRSLGNGDVLTGYFKFSPVGEGLNVLRLSNREVAFGAAWSRPLRNGHPISFSADYADLSITLKDDTGAPVAIKVGTFSISVGYGL